MFRPHIASLTLSLLVSLPVCGGVHCHAAESQWVRHGANGRLVYVPDAEGDRIPDFSDVGYRGGKSAIPTVATAVTVQPVAGDDTATIQAAIAQVSAMPIGADGFRGAVELAAGDYDIEGQLTIGASGVVLRGVGSGSNDTVLHARGTSQRDLIRVLGTGSQSLTGSNPFFIDKVVPVGSRSFRVSSTSGFAVGDQVRITRPSTSNWISDLGMDMIPPRSDGGTVNQWQAGSFDLRFDRVITRIEGDRVFIDAPLTNSFELQYGGGQIRKYNWSGRIENIGIENLRAESDFASDTDEDHSWNFVTIDRAQNVWVKDTISAHFARSAVLSNPRAKWVTVDNAVNLDPKSLVTGSRRYTFDLSGQLELVTDSEANDGRHDFVNNSSRPVGPHVFHNSVANNALNDSGPHQRWATGTLFDNITVHGDEINARNRGNFGTGHGWAGANMVIWNSTADGFIVQNPPTAQNWLVGSTGTIIDDQTFGPQPPGYYDSHGTRVDVDSLYESQVADATDVTTFRWSGADGDWDDAEAWREKLAPGAYRVETRDYLIGDIDDFSFDGAGTVDDAFVDPAWEAYILSTSSHGVTGFDDPATNNNEAFTIQHQLDAGERVVHGTLALALEAAGSGTETDFIRLFDDDPSHKLDFADLGWDAGLAGGGTFVGVVDLGVFTDELQTGAVNVQINDDTSVDWALYTITVASPLASGPAATVLVDGGGQASVNTVVNGVDDLTVGGELSGQLAINAGGSVLINETYAQTANGTLISGLAGASLGQFGAVTVTGDASVAGQLELVLEGGYEPSLGDSFAIVTAFGELSGEFSAIATPGLDAGLGWKTIYGANTVSLAVVLAGDYNGDGAVDAADFTVWRDTLGSTTNLAADGDNNGVINIADYAVWRANFGALASSFGAGGSPTPEPTSAIVAAWLAAIALSTRKERQNQGN